MTTATLNARWRSDSDATWLEWINNFSDMLFDVGLTQTSDTGQYDKIYGTKPGTANTIAGYEIWRFNDTAHSTHPIFLRFSYSTNNNASGPRVLVEVGTGSNGSGTITGSWGTQTAFGPSTSSQATGDTAYNSYACYHTATGSFFIAFGTTSTWQGFFHIGRTCDNTGAADDRAAVATWGAGSSSNLNRRTVYYHSTADARTGTSPGSTAMTFYPVGGWDGTDYNGDYQVHPCFLTTDHGWIATASVCVPGYTSVTAFTPISLTPIGATARTYMPFNIGNSATYSSDTNAHTPAVIWE